MDATGDFFPPTHPSHSTARGLGALGLAAYARNHQGGPVRWICRMGTGRGGRRLSPYLSAEAALISKMGRLEVKPVAMT